jgi:hypothetical protein
MRKLSLTIEWRARPTADGNERLGLAMKMLVERAVEKPKEKRRMKSDPRGPGDEVRRPVEIIDPSMEIA